MFVISPADIHHTDLMGHGSVANAVIYVAILSAFDVSNQRSSFNLVRQACKSISLV